MSTEKLVNQVKESCWLHWLPRTALKPG